MKILIILFAILLLYFIVETAVNIYLNRGQKNENVFVSKIVGKFKKKKAS